MRNHKSEFKHQYTCHVVSGNRSVEASAKAWKIKKGKSAWFYIRCLFFLTLSLHQLVYSPYWSLYISKGADIENLYNNQKLLKSVIVSSTLVTLIQERYYKKRLGARREKRLMSLLWVSRIGFKTLKLVQDGKVRSEGRRGSLAPQEPQPLNHAFF